MLTNIGNYRVLRLLGQGAAARVYLGEHIHLQTRAAIKLLHSQGNLSVSEKQEFLREAKMIANLQHQHIVRVLEFDFTPQGEPFLVMEYAEHGSLRQRHPRGTRLTPAEIYGYLEQIGSALAFIHQSGVVHADIKPENLLLNRQQQLLLGDFGIATLARQTAHLICGTPAYMAPEQIQLHPCAASDQYALASVTYEWLCGQTPFQGTQQELLMRQVLGAVPPPRQFAPTLAPEIEQVLLRALAKDPAARFPDVAAFVSAFARAAQVSITGAVPSSIATPLATPPSTPAPAQQPTQLAAPASGAAATPVSGTATTILPPPAPVTPPAQEPTRSTRKRQGETLYTSNLEGGFVRALAWSPDGKTLAAGCDYQQIFTWDALTGENRRAFHLHEHQIRALAWSPKGRVLASACADQLIHLWEPDSASPRAILTYRGHAGSFTLGLACVVAWSPSGLLLASAGTDRTAQVWRASTGERICTCRGHTKDINALAWSPNGTRLATGSDDGSVRLWDAHSGQLLATFRSHPRVYALAWSPNGTHLASAGEGNSIAIWPASETTSAPDTFYLGHVRSVYALAWSPDGQSVASTGRDATVQIWRASDGAHQYTYREHTSSVLVLAWSPDGEYLASADEDEQVRVWQAQN